MQDTGETLARLPVTVQLWAEGRTDVAGRALELFRERVEKTLGAALPEGTTHLELRLVPVRKD